MNSPSASIATGTINTVSPGSHSAPASRPPAGKPQPRSYRGRFAPSPTGPLHLGSLVAAVASYLRARKAGGEWLLRIEDLDRPRVVPGAVDSILSSLEAHGLAWDGPVRIQSQHVDEYLATADQLERNGLAYRCSCTRQEIRRRSKRGIAGPVYPGTCRRGAKPNRRTAIRLRTRSMRLEFVDLYEGRLTCNPHRDLGDFIIRRRDGLVAYVMACVLDDAAANITEVVRGSDILGFTPAQVWLQSLLELPTPAYAHIPVVRTANGSKLSKQTGAPALDDAQASANLLAAFAFLGCDADPSMAGAAVSEIWNWALDRRIEILPSLHSPRKTRSLRSLDILE